MIDIDAYFDDLKDTAQSGDATEESFYSDLRKLLSAYAEDNGHDGTQITILPRRTEGGNPDFRVWGGQDEITGYIEAKMPSSGDLDEIEQTDQLERYRSTFENVILTNFVKFRLYRDGEQIAEAEVADPPQIPRDVSSPTATHLDEFEELLDKFFSHSHGHIESAEELAVELAKRTRFMKTILLEELQVQQEKEQGDVYGFYQTFKQFLMTDLEEEEFVDIYGQTITYGLLVARTRIEGDFTRRTAADAIPPTIGVLKDIFDFLSARDLPEDIKWIVEEIIQMLSKQDVENILYGYYEDRSESNPLIHFYETFLEKYDPDVRQQKGVYYTPDPIVDFITSSVNSLLKSEYDRDAGLADSTVTLLDPAAGTMTFPAKAASIAINEFTDTYGVGGAKMFISDHIVPNYYAFEILIAAYTIGHLKMAILFEEEADYELDADERVKLFLTNTLEPEEIEQTTIPIASSIAEESQKAHEVKEDTPILAILGNPPYAGHSENKGEWITSLVNDYKDGYPDL